MKIDIERLGIHIDTEGQPYWSYIIVSVALAVMGVLWVWKH